MTDEKMNIQEQETQHLKGGQESPDMAELRLTIGYMVTELNSVISNIGLQVSQLTDAITELTNQVEGVKDGLHDIHGTGIAQMVTMSDDTLNKIQNRLSAINKTLSKPISEERGFEPALRIEGDRIYNTPCI